MAPNAVATLARIAGVRVEAALEAIAAAVEVEVVVGLEEAVAVAKEIVGRFRSEVTSRRAEAAGSILGMCHAGRMTLRDRGPRAFLVTLNVCRQQKS